MNIFGASGLDGFPPEFYQHFWYLIKDEITIAVREMFTSKWILDRLNHTFLVLIPKVEEENKIEAFHLFHFPTAFIILFLRWLQITLKQVIPKIISQEQKAFVKGHKIMDGAILIHELIHSLKFHKNKGLLLKLDMKKAFDRFN